MSDRSSPFQSLRDELPKCGRHRDASHIDCVECMYLSTEVYATLEVIEQALREIAELPEPLNNKGAALAQCAYLKQIARRALDG